MANQTTLNSQKREVLFSNNRVNSNELFEKSRELTIIHNNEEYKLRLTGKDKLILTK